MLSRTAEGLFWIARNLERAETYARLLQVGYRMSMTPSPAGGYESEWSSVLAATGNADEFSRHYDEVNERNVENFLSFDARNPSSIKNCIASARNNARANRVAVTTEVWEALNHAYLEFRELEKDQNALKKIPDLVDWVKRQSATIRGSFLNTQLLIDSSDFFNLGYYLERADNTARLLDVKYFVLLPTIHMVGGSVDSYQWMTLLRAVSAVRAFHWTYGGDHSPERIAHFLILNPACPRSLFHCCDRMEYHFSRLAKLYGTSNPAHYLLAERLERFYEADIRDIIKQGLHEFLSKFIADMGKLNNQIAESYLFER